MDHRSASTTLFNVYLRLRPAAAGEKERFLDVDEASEHGEAPTHITIKPPADDKRRRAVERFAFTRVFDEYVGQREIFEQCGLLSQVEGVLGPSGREGRDGLVATLGVTGHTMLGSKSQRGITQLALDVLFRHAAPYLVNTETSISTLQSLSAADNSEAHLASAAHYLDTIAGGDGSSIRGGTPNLDGARLSAMVPKMPLPRTATMPRLPRVDDINFDVDRSAEYAVVLCMYEVYNDRIFDLLASRAAPPKALLKRRALVFKNTEMSQDRKVVAGLRKVVCSSLEDALLVLEAGLQERRVAGTGSNAVSSRSHGFIAVEVKKRHKARIPGPWSSSTLTIVDLAGSERARTAKTAGATLAEAGKINESLMYLGQCMQMQSDHANAPNSVVVPFRQCKLTELLFGNSVTTKHRHKAPQKSTMIVTADPLGDYNATSQILRYSALAREVTVPRMPSLASTIVSGTSRPSTRQAHNTDHPTSSALQEELELALATVADLRQQLEVMRLLLADETKRREEAENSWRVAEARANEIEVELRDELCNEYEQRLLVESRRWRAARDAEIETQEGFVDQKLTILAETMEENEENLAEENSKLKKKIAALEKASVPAQRSPSKKMRTLKTPSKKWNSIINLGLGDTMTSKSRLKALSEQLSVARPDPGQFEDIPRIATIAGPSTGPRTKDKVVIITGGNSPLGIGRATAHLFAANGAKAIFLCDLTTTHLETHKRELNSLYPNVDIHTCGIDASSEPAVAGVVDSALAKYGRLDVFFANAGVNVTRTSVLDSTVEDFMEIMRINALSVFLAVKHGARGMLVTSSEKPYPGGSVIGTASSAGLRSNAGPTDYSASKAAVVSIVQTACYQLAGTGIRCNALCPGLIETGITKEVYDLARKKGTEGRIGQLNPLRRGGIADEIARVALFLGSDEASYVNGQAWAVCGGLTAGHPYVPGKLA
ncbi:P-loop containing nucleoside triphosphate hydrolase protein [Piedraia hortae CBS 480.64]|uniref:Kinesin-like protein n=1 Tax=Piedraia hortae CBS 480.64 TaxID=1314780 RepID=A0A6A7BX62_9PEZI|nr:P-loop containing nucleoside triphosphate hydrolase protein [Piedraia hortae CBS 480.64]